MVPVVLFLLVGGVWADRLPRHLVMLGSDIGRGVVQALLAVLLLTGRAELWHLLVLQALYGVAEAFMRPAATGLLPTIVQGERLQRANALMAASVNTAYIVGPAIAGVLVAAAGAGTAIAIDAGTFAVSTASLALLRVPAAAERAARLPFLADLREGWREFVSRTWLWATVAGSSLYLLAVIAPLMVLGPVVADRELGGAGAWGAIAAAIGLGTLAGQRGRGPGQARAADPRRRRAVGRPGLHGGRARARAAGSRDRRARLRRGRDRGIHGGRLDHGAPGAHPGSGAVARQLVRHARLVRLHARRVRSRRARGGRRRYRPDASGDGRLRGRGPPSSSRRCPPSATSAAP